MNYSDNSIGQYEVKVMKSNIDIFKQELDQLISQGEQLFSALLQEFTSELNNESKAFLEFIEGYQSWYSESLSVIRQLLPDRFADFTRLYERPKAIRKEITRLNYVIEDCLYGISINNVWDSEVIVEPKDTILLFKQQINILKSVKKRFSSTLFNIKQLTQADLFDSELEAAEELNRKGFIRGAGAIAGVVLEKHLSQVCENHNIKINKKTPHISDYNEELKKREVYEIPIWRKIQHLGDLRNLCDHNKQREPEPEDVEELIEGVAGIIKNIY
jgi:hypothetical protein